MKTAENGFCAMGPRRGDCQGARGPRCGASGLRRRAPREFFAEKANIRLGIGEPYEIQFDPQDERSGTKGLKILSYAPEEMISFQWNAPPEMPEARNGGTWVVVQMRPDGTDRTRVTVTHYGWKDGAEWDRAFVHFTRGWGDLMKRLERRFTDGSIDWNKERMMYQESRERNHLAFLCPSRRPSDLCRGIRSQNLSGAVLPTRQTLPTGSHIRLTC